jgi:hypothetical protein
MTESSGITWSTHESIRSQSEYDTRHKVAGEIQSTIDRCLDRGLNNHFIAGLELAKGIALGLTKDSDSNQPLDSETLF